MAIESQNIYKNARKSAGFTQEKASQLLNVSVDSLRDYEQSQRPVPSDVASAMCDVYQAPYLAVQHLRLTSDLGKRVVPEIQLKDLPEAVLGVLAAVQRFCAKREAMVEIAADGQIAESEQAEWDEIMCLANDLNQRYFYWVCIGASVRRHPECGRLYCIHVQLGRRTFRTQQPEKVHQRLPAALVQFGAAGCTGNRQGRYLRGEYRKNSQGVPECSRSDS